MQPLAASEYQYMYQEGHVADGQTVWLKPYFYVLNNILRQTLYPKIVDSTFLQDDSPVVLDCFGDEFTKFSIGHYIWDKIFQASEETVKHFPYAPYIMHIIEQVSSLKFPTDAPHTMLKISNKMSLQAKNALKKGASGASGSRSRTHSRSSSPPASCSHRASSEEAPSSTSSKRPPNKFKFFMQYMFGACCASAQREQDMLERQYRLD